jgi:hypothetical protein
MTTTEQNQNSSANTSPDEPEEKSFEGIPLDHFENDVSGKITMNEDDLADFDAETEQLLQASKG